MSTFTIHFYRTSTGACPVEQFLESLNVKMRAKALYSLEILEEFGCNLKEPHSKYLDHGLYELRIQFAGDIARIFYFFQIGRTIILTNGFVKKTRKTPQSQIELALKYKLDYERRQRDE